MVISDFPPRIPWKFEIKIFPTFLRFSRVSMNPERYSILSLAKQNWLSIIYSTCTKRKKKKRKEKAKIYLITWRLRKLVGAEWTKTIKNMVSSPSHLLLLIKNWNPGASTSHSTSFMPEIHKNDMRKKYMRMMQENNI